MKINKNNYEAFFLDYHEGNLTPQEVADLLLYVAQHPELKEEFESFETISIENKSTIYFENKNELKKQIAITDEQLISAIEGTLTVNELTQFNQQLKTDLNTQRQFKLYQHTKLIADTTIKFENKNSLKHKENRVIPLFSYFAIAASILLLIGLFIFNNINQPIQLITGDLKKSAAKETYAGQKIEMASTKESNEPALTPPTNKVFRTTVKKIAIKATEENTPNGFTKNTVQDTLNSNHEQVLAKVVHVPDSLLIAFAESTINKKEDLNTEAIKEEMNSNAYLSLPEIAIKKMKEKTQHENGLSSTNKKNCKKINGWDVAQIITGAISKITGKDIEIKTSYNEQGDLTAYAFNAGKINFSKNK
jgi:hypothetical protein